MLTIAWYAVHLYSVCYAMLCYVLYFTLACGQCAWSVLLTESYVILLYLYIFCLKVYSAHG